MLSATVKAATGALVQNLVKQLLAIVEMLLKSEFSKHGHEFDASNFRLWNSHRRVCRRWHSCLEAFTLFTKRCYSQSEKTGFNYYRFN